MQKYFTVKDWIIDQLKENDLNKNKLYGLYDKFKKDCPFSCMSQSSFERKVRERYNEILEDAEITNAEKLKVKAKQQAFQDKNRELNKLVRETVRPLNLARDNQNHILNLLEDHKKEIKKLKLYPSKLPKEKKYGLMTLADIHAGQEIDEACDLNNVYNFEILSARLKYYVDYTIDYFKKEKVTDVLIVGLGDFVSSQRRLSEKLTASSSIMSVVLLIFYLLKQAFVQLGKNFRISFISIVGNESRNYDDNMSSFPFLVYENSDFLLFHLLRETFNNEKNFKFYESNYREVYFDFGGKKFLILHGDTLRKNNFEKQIQNLIGKQNLIFKRDFDYVLFGNYHHNRIEAFFACIGSMMGADPYAQNDLHFPTRASQALFLVSKNSVEGKIVDLHHIQNVKDYKGYSIIEELVRYNVKGFKRKINNRIIIENLI